METSMRAHRLRPLFFLVVPLLIATAVLAACSDGTVLPSGAGSGHGNGSGSGNGSGNGTGGPTPYPTCQPTPGSILGCGGPVVTILAPSANSVVYASEPFDLVARAVDSDPAVTPLPAAQVIWTANGNTLGNGAVLTTSLATAGTDTIEVLVNNGKYGATASTTLNVQTPPSSSAPQVEILSPAPGEEYSVPQGGNIQIVLSSNFAGGVTQYAWSDSAHLISDTQANDTITIAQSQVGCATVNDTISLTGTTGSGQASAPATVNITLLPQCI